MKKFLDINGVQYLWSKVPLQDYPNNDTLVAVLNVIDETKADKEEIVNKQDKITGVAGQFVVIGEDGFVTTKTIPVAEEMEF